jgi:acyl-CoA synthetase (AMP-forming)/AMP-acid ligase II
MNYALDNRIPALEGAHDSLGQALGAAADQFGDRDAYVMGAERLTYRDWLRRADAVAGVLAERGVRPGDVVAIMLNAGIDYPVVLAAIARLGCVATGLNLRLGPREAAAILEICTPSAIVAEDGLVLPPQAGAAVIRRGELAKPAAPCPFPLPQPRRPEDPAVIIWTSGTTGTPKGAWFDHRNLRAQVDSAGPLAAPYDRKLISTPLVHAGYMAKPWEQLAFGMTLILSPTPWTAGEMLRLMVDERITLVGGAPTQLAKLLEQPGLAQADLSALRLCVAATAPAPPELVEAATARLGCPVIVRYAMSECPSITGSMPGDAPDILYRTVGRPVPSTELRITDETGRPLPDGEVGQVRVRSPCMMRGYWNAPEQTRAALAEDGWLRSGDLGYLDPAGNLVLAGRLTDMFIRGGYNVYPLEVENVLTEHPAVAAAAVVGLPTPVIGEIGVAFVAPVDPARPPELEALRAWCRERLADYKAPDRLEILSELPMTSVMKIDKAALRRRLEAQPAAS